MLGKFHGSHVSIMLILTLQHVFIPIVLRQNP